MTSIANLTALELLDWLTETRSNPQYIRGLTQLGVTDLDTLRLASRYRDSTLATITSIAEARAGQPPLVEADDRTLLNHVTTVGTEVFVRDYENLTQWIQVAELYTEHRSAFNRAKGPDGEHRARHIAQEIDAFVRSGRGPEYATAMIHAAVKVSTAPDVHGYGDDMTPAIFEHLILNGIPNRAALNIYFDAGLTAAEAFEIAHAGIPARIVRAAAQDNVPRDTWAQLLPGLPERWFPEGSVVEPRDDHRNGMLSVPGITWEIMRELTDHGWADVSPWDLRNKKTGYKNDACSDYDLDNVLRAVRNGFTQTEITGWVRVLHTGKGGTEWWERALPSLSGRYYATLPNTIDMAVAVRAAGVKPSWIGDYRALGARSVDTAIRFAKAGITGQRAKYLLKTFGERKYAHDPLRMRSADATIRAHEDDLAGTRA